MDMSRRLKVTYILLALDVGLLIYIILQVT